MYAQGVTMSLSGMEKESVYVYILATMTYNIANEFDKIDACQTQI